MSRYPQSVRATRCARAKNRTPQTPTLAPDFRFGRPRVAPVLGNAELRITASGHPNEVRGLANMVSHSSGRLISKPDVLRGVRSGRCEGGAARAGRRKSPYMGGHAKPLLSARALTPRNIWRTPLGGRRVELICTLCHNLISQKKQ